MDDSDPRFTHDFDPTVPETFTSPRPARPSPRHLPRCSHKRLSRVLGLFKYEDVLDALRRHDTFVTPSVQNASATGGVYGTPSAASF